MLSAATVANYKLDTSSTSATYYYAKRGCAGSPEDGRQSGDQSVADRFVHLYSIRNKIQFSFITPPGYTGVKQTNQRTTSTKSNTLQASSVSIATVFDCFACSSTMSLTRSSNADEPTYDSFIGKPALHYVLRY